MNYKQISKITFYSIIMGIFALIGIITFATDFPNWIKYGSNFLVDPEIFKDTSSQLLPISVQAARATSAFSLIFCILLSGLSAWEIKKMEKTNYKKYYIASLGIFTWLIIPYTFYIGLRDRLYSEFFTYLSQNRISSLQLSFKSFKNGLSKNGVRNGLFWNTVFGYFVFLVTLVGFILCFIIAENIFGIEKLNPINPDELKPGFSKFDYWNSKESNLIFEILSYFTQLTNIICFLFMFSFIFFSRKIIFRNNSIMIATTSYIFIVLVIFWAYLFPQSLSNNDYVVDFQWAKTSWLHAVTPILFIAFSITSTFLSKEGPTSFKRLAINSIIFPLFYGIYVYSLPFYTRFSVYGSLTNMNPNMDTSVGIEGVSKTGSYLMILGIVGLALVFIFVFFCFWLIAFHVNKNENKKIKIA